MRYPFHWGIYLWEESIRKRNVTKFFARWKDTIGKLPYVQNEERLLLSLRIEFVRIEVGGPIRKEPGTMEIWDGE